MRGGDTTVAARSSKKTSPNGRSGPKLSKGSQALSTPIKPSSNGTADTKSSHKKNKSKSSKADMGAGNTKPSNTPNGKTKSSPRGKKDTLEARPRRRASQTYFFKYQLARNPLKAEEEDLKLALMASLEQCGASRDSIDTDCNSEKRFKRGATGDSDDDHDKSKGLKKKPSKDSPGHMGANACNSGKSRHGSKKLAPATHSKNWSVQDKIKKAKEVLQNKQANKGKSKAGSILSKYSTLRKYPSNSSGVETSKDSHKKRETPAGSISGENSNSSKSKSKSRLNPNCYYDDHSATATPGTTSFTSYTPYTPLQKTEPPDEDYLRKYKPETEDFLTFICFRTTAPYHPDEMSMKNGTIDDTNLTLTPISTDADHGFSSTINGRTNTRDVSQDLHNLRKPTSTQMKLLSNGAPALEPYIPPHLSPTNIRRPTRQSPRLANSNRKISEIDGSVNTNTAYDNSMTYEEDMKRASIALEVMAQGISCSSGAEISPSHSNMNGLSKTLSQYKDNKHLVEGLMTRKFAGAFADEETIFESISNHKL